MSTAYSYIRFSTAGQKTGSSNERQLMLAKGWCKRNKITLSEKSYNDFGVSGWTGENLEIGALAAFIKAAEKGDIKKGDYLIIEKIDRFSRAEIATSFANFSRLLDLGIKIVTTEPERIYTKENTKDFAVLEIIVHFLLAHQESQKKSERLTHAWNIKRGKIRDGFKITGVVPAWLKLNDDKHSFTVDKDKVKVIKTMFDLALKGKGLVAITKHLNANNVPTFGFNKRSTQWHKSYIFKILNNKAIIGEYDSYSGDVGPDRKFLENHKNYYPQIVTDEKFYAVQKAMQSRHNKQGRPTKRNSNLFTGLLYDVVNKCTFTMVDKHRPQIVSSNGQNGKGNYLSFPYMPLEESILKLTKEINFQPRNEDDKIENDYQNQLDATILSIAKLQAKYDATESEPILNMIVAKGTKKKELEQMIKEQKINSGAVDRKKVNQLIDKVNGSPEHRAELKQYLLQLIESIDIYIQVASQRDRVAYVNMTFKNGATKYFQIVSSHDQWQTKHSETLEKENPLHQKIFQKALLERMKA